MKIDTIQQQIPAQVSQDLRNRKTKAWIAERDYFRKGALDATNDEWASYDDERSARALLAIQKVLIDVHRRKASPEELVLHTGLILSTLINQVSADHATRCEDNGQLESGW